MQPISADAWDGGAKVGAAFQGRAREFHSRLIISSLRSLKQMHQIRTDAVRRAEARSAQPRPMRPEVLLEIERACRLVPMRGCLRRTVQHDRKTLSVGNVWLIPAFSRAGEWDAGEEERTLSLISDTLEIDRRGGVNCIRKPLAGVSLHALGRWYARAFAVSDEALMADLLRVAVFAEHSTGVGGQEFTLATARGGAWRGQFCTTTVSWDAGTRCLVQVRTFF